MTWLLILMASTVAWANTDISSSTGALWHVPLLIPDSFAINPNTWKIVFIDDSLPKKLEVTVANDATLYFECRGRKLVFRRANDSKNALVAKCEPLPRMRVFPAGMK